MCDSTQPPKRRFHKIRSIYTAVIAFVEKNKFLTLIILPLIMGWVGDYTYDKWNEDTNLKIEQSKDVTIVVQDCPEEIGNVLKKKVAKAMDDGDYEEALAYLDALEKIYSEEDEIPPSVKASVQGFKGECLLELERFEEAKAELSKCIETEGVDPHFRDMLTEALYRIAKKAAEARGEDTKTLDEWYEHNKDAYSKPIGLLYQDLNIEIPIDHTLPPFLTSLDRGATTHVILIGIGDYADVSVPDLSYTNEDVSRMYDALTATNATDVRFTYITGKEATKENILSTVRTVAREAGSGDGLLVYFTGHGVTYDPALPDFYSSIMYSRANMLSDQLLLPQDWTNDYPIESGLMVDDIVGEALAGDLTVPPLVILDVCRTDKIDVLDNAPRIRSWTSNYLLPLDNRHNYSPHVSDFGVSTPLDQFSDRLTRDCVGAYVLNAVRHGERATVNTQLEGSVFTHALTNTLRETFYENPSGRSDLNTILDRTRNWIETYDNRFDTSNGTPQIGVYVKKSPATDYCQ